MLCFKIVSFRSWSKDSRDDKNDQGDIVREAGPNVSYRFFFHLICSFSLFPLYLAPRNRDSSMPRLKDQQERRHVPQALTGAVIWKIKCQRLCHMHLPSLSIMQCEFTDQFF